MIHKINEIVWGPWLLFAFLAVGFYYSFSGRFFQIRKFWYWMGQTVGSLGGGQDNGETVRREQAGEKKKVSQFQSACTALAATIGTGNIVGVATALTAGGPGAIFWMWVSAVIGMMTAYSETVLGLKYRYKNKQDQWVCGPMVYLDKGLHMPVLGILYAFFCVMASLGMGSMVQANSLADTAGYSLGMPGLVCGALVTILVFLVIRGGISKISLVAEKLMPVSAGIYFIFSMIIIFSYYQQIPQMIAGILRSAFDMSAVFGGTAGYCINKSLQYGISRGVFSNEAGLGTLAVLHGAAEDTTPKKQGMWAMFEVFFDTVVICTLTAFVILLATGGRPEAADVDGAALTAYCFSIKMGAAGEYFVAFSMIVFAFATIIAWYYMGKQAVSYLTERVPKSREIGEKIYMLLYLNAVFLGCLARLETVWEFSDIWNGLLAVPNLIGLMLLRKQVGALDN